MKIKNIKQPNDFFTAVHACKGSVELRTADGDNLNMRSKLCQYIMLTQLFDDRNLQDVELVLSEPEDWEKLADFVVRD